MEEDVEGLAVVLVPARVEGEQHAPAAEGRRGERGQGARGRGAFIWGGRFRGDQGAKEKVWPNILRGEGRWVGGGGGISDGGGGRGARLLLRGTGGGGAIRPGDRVYPHRHGTHTFCFWDTHSRTLGYTCDTCKP